MKGKLDCLIDGGSSTGYVINRNEIAKSRTSMNFLLILSESTSIVVGRNIR